MLKLKKPIKGEDESMENREDNRNPELAGQGSEAKNVRRRGRPRKNVPGPTDESGVGTLPERMFTPSRATEIEATPLPDLSPVHDRTAAVEDTRCDPFGERGRDLCGEDFDVRQEPKPAPRSRREGPCAVQLPSRARYHGVAVPIRRKHRDGTGSDPDRGEPERPDGGRERSGRRERGGRKRCYDDGCLSGWTVDPEYGSATLGNARESFHCVSIIGQIEGHCWLPEGQKATKYEHIIPTLVSVEEDDRTDGLLVLLNTMGGDVEAGLAIAEMIASMTKPTVSLVLGGGHSIGVPLATAADYSLIVPSATMTIHPVRVSGMVIGVPQSFRYMSEMQERITRFICAHSKASPDAIRELMMRPDQIATDCGTILEGDEAVRYGIIDEVGGLDRALAVLRELCKKKKG